MARSSSPRPAARPTRRPSPGGDVDTMKVTGVLFCLSAVASTVAAFARKEATGWPSESAAPLGGAFMVLVLGAALFQGVGAVRIFVLVAAGLGGMAALVAIALLGSFRELQVLLGAVLLTCIGYLVLLLDKQSSRARAVVGVGLALLGAAGTLGAPQWLTGFERRAFARELRPLFADEREYADAASGLSLQAPAGWRMLRRDAELFASVPAKVKLADPDAGTVAFLNDEPRPLGFVSLDHHLDGVLESQREGGLEPTQYDRRDTTVGKAPARRMSMGWKHSGRPYSGFVSVWLDGPQVFTLVGAAVGGWSSATEDRFRALEASLRFSAPIETALSGAERALTRECPVFTTDAVRMIGRRISPSSPVEAYFRAGWSMAIRGQGEVDPRTAAELRELMSAVFARMPAPDRARFAAYGERLRAGLATTAAEDAAAMRVLGTAATALPSETLHRLRLAVDSAVTIGALT
jgi:hypothetical protein